MHDVIYKEKEGCNKLQLAFLFLSFAYVLRKYKAVTFSWVTMITTIAY